MANITKTEIKKLMELTLAKNFGVRADEATENMAYRALCTVVKDILTQKRLGFKNKVRSKGYKQVYYMSMEFLLGRSLRNHLFNIGLLDEATSAVKELGYDINKLMSIEPDAGLGNGG